MKEKMTEKKTEVTMWGGAGSGSEQEKANKNTTGINLQKAKLNKIQK